MTQRTALPPEGLLTAGRITGCYGIKGWVRVHPYTDQAESLLDFPDYLMADYRGSSCGSANFDADPGFKDQLSLYNQFYRLHQGPDSDRLPPQPAR